MKPLSPSESLQKWESRKGEFGELPNTTQYYKSVEELAEQTLARHGRFSLLDWAQLLAFLATTLSVLPAIPAALQSLIPEKYGPKLIVRGHSVPLDSLLLWWLFCSLASIALVFAVTKLVNRRDKKLKKVLLSAAQLRFALAYGIVDRITKFKTNKRDVHLEEAGKFLERLPRFMTWTSFGADGQHVVVKPGRPFPVSTFEFVGVLPKKFRWFKLDTDTVKVIDAFQDFRGKFCDRLKDKRDLSLVEDAMRSLADYFYTEIPEITEDSQNNTLPEWGTKKILRFAEIVNNAPEYKSENSTVKKDFPFKLWLGISAAFQHPNTLFCFFSWYLLCLILAIAGFWIVFEIFTNLKVDSAIVAALVIGPITAAAAIVAISSRSRESKEKS